MSDTDTSPPATEEDADEDEDEAEDDDGEEEAEDEEKEEEGEESEEGDDEAAEGEEEEEAEADDDDEGEEEAGDGDEGEEDEEAEEEEEEEQVGGGWRRQTIKIALRRHPAAEATELELLPTCRWRELLRVIYTAVDIDQGGGGPAPRLKYLDESGDRLRIKDARAWRQVREWHKERCALPPSTAGQRVMVWWRQGDKVRCRDRGEDWRKGTVQSAEGNAPRVATGIGGTRGYLWHETMPEFAMRDEADEHDVHIGDTGRVLAITDAGKLRVSLDRSGARPAGVVFCTVGSRLQSCDPLEMLIDIPPPQPAPATLRPPRRPPHAVASSGGSSSQFTIGEDSPAKPLRSLGDTGMNASTGFSISAAWTQRSVTGSSFGDLSGTTASRFSVRADLGVPPGVSSERPKWQAGRVLGKGLRGNETQEGLSRTGKLVAVKHLPNAGEAERQCCRTFTALDHPGLVRLYCACPDEGGGGLLLFMEHCPGGSMRSLHARFRSLQAGTLREYLLQLLNTLAYLHEKGVAHGAIRLEKLLLGESGVVKLSPSLEAGSGPAGAAAQSGDVRRLAECCCELLGGAAQPPAPPPSCPGVLADLLLSALGKRPPPAAELLRHQALSCPESELL